MSSNKFIARNGLAVGTAATEVVDSSGTLLVNAPTATKLLTARTISLTGDVAGSVSFDGSGNAAISTTIQADSVALGTDTTGNYMVNVSAGTGVSVSHTQGEGSTATVSIGQAVGITDNVTFNNVTVNGTLTSDDITSTNISVAGNATITGNLTVSGTTTTVNSTTIALADANLELARNATTAAQANGAGITVTGPTTPATITYSSADDRWNLNKNLNVTTVYGALSGNASTATALATGRTIAITGDITYTSGSFDGTANVTGAATLATVNSNVGTYTKVTVNGKGLVTAASSATTSDIGEGTNLYYTDTRARAAHSFTAGSGAYNSTTGVITIPTNTNQLTNGAGFITGYTETDTLATVTGRGFVARTSTGTFATATQGTPAMEVQGAGGTDPAYMTFHRPGAYAVRFGLDGNDLKVGGWSMGANAYTMWHSGNLTNLNQLTNGPGYITGESDTLATVTARGSTTSTRSTFNGGWTVPDATVNYVGNFQTTDYSTFTFMSRAWSSVQGTNGIAYQFNTHSNAGGGGYNALQINYGEGGKVQASTSFRAPIFYDSDDTGYYLNPAASGSVALRVMGEVRFLANDGNTTHFNYSNGGSENYLRGTTYFDSGNVYFQSGRLRWTGAAYDWDDTGYYLDPASTSVLSFTRFQVSGYPIAEFRNTNSANYGLIEWTENGTHKMWMGMGGSTQVLGAYSAYAQDGFSINHDGSGAFIISNRGASKWIKLSTGTEGTSNFNTFNVRDGNVIVNQESITYSASDNTPLVGSFTTNRLHVNGSIQLTNDNDAIVIGRGTSSFFKDEEIGFGWGGGWYMTDGTYLRVRNGSSIQLYTAGIMRADSDMRAPIFYDQNDTTYYLNPNSTSYLYNLSLSNYATTAQAYPGILNIGNINYNYLFTNGSWSSSVTAGLLANCADQWEMAIHDSGTRVVSPFAFYGGGSNYILMGRDIGWGTTYIEASSSFRAPIFYDSNDTGYYVNPNGRSNFSSLQFDNGNLYMYQGDGTALRIQTAYGWINFGAQNSSWTHVYADRAFYTNQDWYVNGNLMHHDGNASRARNSYLMYYQGFTLDANTMDHNATGFTYSVNAPATGPIARFSTGGGYDLWLNAAYGGGNTLYFRTRNGDSGSINAWRALASYGINYGDSLYSTITYDANNTAYYVDPNGFSQMSSAEFNSYARVAQLVFTGVGGDSGLGSVPTSYGIYQQGGAWTHPYPDLCIGYHTGIKIGAYLGYNGTRFYNNSDWATQIFSVGDGDNNVRSYYDMRSTVYYDINDTGYYCDPNGTNRLNFVNSNNHYIQPGYMLYSDHGSWQGEYNKIQWHSGHLYLQNGGGGYLLILRRGDGGERFYCDYNGNVTVSGNITANSDIRLKRNVETIKNPIELVKRLRGVTFDWIESGKHSYGLIAQEVEEVIPELVLQNITGTADGDEKTPIKSVDYSKIVSVLIEAIKEQQSQIDELKALVNTLLAK